MKDTLYWTTITDSRAQLLDQDEATEATALLSLETVEELTEDVVSSLFVENFGLFLQYLRLLPNYIQDLIISNYILKKPQKSLSVPFVLTQTVISSTIWLGIRAMSAIMMWGGHPTADQLRPLTEAVSMETKSFVPVTIDRSPVTMSLSALVSEYAACRNFSVLAKKYNLHRPVIRRWFRTASETMYIHADPAVKATGAYITLLIDRASFAGNGLTARTQRKMGDIRRVDPDILGEFRVRVEHKDFDQMFSARSTIK